MIKKKEEIERDKQKRDCVKVWAIAQTF